MSDRFMLSVVLFFVMGSAAVSSMDGISTTVKSIFYVVGMVVLMAIGVTTLYKYVKASWINEE